MYVGQCCLVIDFTLADRLWICLALDPNCRQRWDSLRYLCVGDTHSKIISFESPPAVEDETYVLT